MQVPPEFIPVAAILPVAPVAVPVTDLPARDFPVPVLLPAFVLAAVSDSLSEVDHSPWHIPSESGT